MNYIEPSLCQKRILEKDDLFVIDIREDYEYEQCNVGFKHIPMAEIADRMDEIPTGKSLVIMCQSGRRAEAVVNLLETEYHFPHVFVMKDGINGWIEQLEPTLQQN